MIAGFANNGAFSVPAPEPGDDRPRNAFGFCTGFGNAYSAYYAKQDEELARNGVSARKHGQQPIAIRDLPALDGVQKELFVE